MTLKRQDSPQQVGRRRARMIREAEGKLEDASGAAIRTLLRRVQQSVTPDALTAAGEVGRPMRLFTLGQAHDWWEDAIDAHVLDAVRAVWRTGYFDTRDGELLRSSLEQAEGFVAHVKDRLSRTAQPTIPEQAMDRARLALSDELARGSSTAETSRRLAAEFGWDEDGQFWRGRLAELDAEVDRTLDAIGPPGDQAREAARLNDPRVRELQDRRAEARLHIDRVQSEWQTRADRIARTESTSAFNAGAEDAYRVEGAGVKVWLATGDERTRDDHLDAHGQCVAVEDDFDVGGALLHMPGDPSGPAELIINCRCTTVAASSCAEADEMFGFTILPEAAPGYESR